MKGFAAAICSFAFIASAGAETAATSTVSSVCSTISCRAAPAPEIGTGLPVAIVLGGILLGTTLMRWRKS